MEKGICLTGNVYILSKLVILLNHKRHFDQENLINCIFLIIFHSQQANYIIFLLFVLRFTQVFYFILGCKLIPDYQDLTLCRSLIIVLDLGVFCDQ